LLPAGNRTRIPPSSIPLYSLCSISV
jgi:hypothetical protein